jgi:hypothetical protein
MFRLEGYIFLYTHIFFHSTGDPEAEEILSNIVDYVSRDNDPNDEEQVKSILGMSILMKSCHAINLL